MGDPATAAARAAARLRADLGIGPAELVCPFDAAERRGVSVRLVALPTLEGMYFRAPVPTIFVSVERPPPRRRFTCAHEIGHHEFGHGTSLDQDDLEATPTSRTAEYMAQRFAAALLMPSLALRSSVAARRWDLARLTPANVFVLAQELGVGFTTLVGHLEMTRLISSSAAGSLRRVRLPALREDLAGTAVPHDLVVVDDAWRRSTVDVEVGDVVVLPHGARLDGPCAPATDAPVVSARAQGCGMITMPDGRELTLRVMRRGYMGLARYRHLDEVNDER